MEWNVVFLILLPIVAFLYASVGHGGASGYLALMALFSLPVEVMRPTALLLNLFVAGISFFHFWKQGFFRWKLFVVFAISSVPMAYIGGMLNVDVKTYKVILGILLIFAIIRMLGFASKEVKEFTAVRWVEGLGTGAVIGFFSGLIGIGGGIILSPVILIFRWGSVKEAAAVSALFIWVNSAAGLLGQLTEGVKILSGSWILVLLALTGGFLGGYIGSKKLNNKNLRHLLAFVLILASIKLILA